MTPQVNAITRIFGPKRLLTGLIAVVFGGGLLIWTVFYSVGWRGRVRAIELGAVALVIGIGMILSAFAAEGCARCRTEFDETYTVVPLELLDRLQEALLAAAVNVEPLVAFGDTPIPPCDIVRAASIEVEYCSTCKEVARLASATRRLPPHDGGTADDPSLWILVTGDDVRRVLDMIEGRNGAWRMFHGGAA